jgi:hypothetical protein
MKRKLKEEDDEEDEEDDEDFVLDKHEEGLIRH